jgi:hypothetical protein
MTLPVRSRTSSLLQTSLPHHPLTSHLPRNQTNLALKGILGISAMSQIATLTSHPSTAANYSSIASDYISQWQTLGFALDATPPHATLSYGQNSSWGLLYNLFADRELGLGLVPQRVYDIQDEFYGTVFERWGVPLDTRHGYTKSEFWFLWLLITCQSSVLITLPKTDDWELYIAAVSSPELRDRFISTIAAWLGTTSTNGAFTDLYDASSGE